MAACIGIRREDRNEWEGRAPLPPSHVRQLVDRGLTFVVQPSDIRAFSDAAYRCAGARIDEDLSACPVVLAVKEVPLQLLLPGRTYVCFPHVIKGQAHNMPVLRRLLELRCTLIDYERIVDEDGQRLVVFGRHAGLAGMLDALWALGRRLAAEGFDTPFAALRPTHAYEDLEEAKEAIRAVGHSIEVDGLPDPLVPLAVGFAGYGNTSQGAQEVFDLLPHLDVAPEDLADMPARRRRVFKSVFFERHLVERLDPADPFDLAEYYARPGRYRGIFGGSLPHLTVLMNCTYWDARYPRLVTLGRLRELHEAGARPRLRVIGDVSCDVGGAIECTVNCTDPGDPVYVYRPETGEVVPGVEGPGPVVLAVDALPCQLPLDSTEAFGEALLPFVEAIANADYSRPLEELELPDPIRRAVITHHGSLTPDYAHLARHL